MHSPFNRSRGFTLVELLVVIGIIAMLISILLPTMGRAVEMSRRMKCMSNQRQIVNAVIMYHIENKSLPGPIAPAIIDPKIANDPNGVMSGTAEKNLDRLYNLSNENVLFRYLSRGREVFFCPSNTLLRDNASPFHASSIYKGTPLGYSFKVNNQDNTGVPYFFGS